MVIIYDWTYVDAKLKYPVLVIGNSNETFSYVIIDFDELLITHINTAVE